jgi:hypothetical protein
MGVGITVRDNMGLVLASLCMLVPYVIDQTMVEAYGLKTVDTQFPIGDVVWILRVHKGEGNMIEERPEVSR